MTSQAPSEGRRRALHLASGALAVASHLSSSRFGPGAVTAFLVALVLLALALEAARLHPVARAALARASGGAFRPAEARGVSGATLLAAGYAGAWIVSPGTAAPAMLVAAVADPLAAVAGRRAHPGRSGKSSIGTAAALIASAGALAVWGLVFGGIDWLQAAVGAGVAAAAERIPGRGADNVTVPVATALALRMGT